MAFPPAFFELVEVCEFVLIALFGLLPLRCEAGSKRENFCEAASQGPEDIRYKREHYKHTAKRSAQQTSMGYGKIA